MLEGDSVSDITDLSKDGILVSSMHKLSAKERKKLSKLTSEWRNMQKFEAPKHNCMEKKKTVKRTWSGQFKYEMELRAKSEPKHYADEENDAHQFSVRSKSI